MSENIVLKTWNGELITPKHDAIVQDTLTQMNGIYKGCEITYNAGNILHMAAGYGMIKGRLFEIYDTDIEVELPQSGTKAGRLYVHMDLSNTEKPIQLMVYTGDTLPDLEQDENINFDNGVWEMEMATFTANIGSLSNIVSTFDSIVGRFDRIETIIGDTDISAIGDGTLTGAIDEVNASLTENLNDISLRYNTTSSRPEWKERGADTWNPFSSGFPKYIDELCNRNNLVVGSAHYDENTTKTFYEFLAPENTYLYFIVGRIGAAGDSSTITATNADVIAFRANTGTYANRAKHCILKTTTTSKIHVEGVIGSFILMNAIDDSIITTSTDKGENTTFSVTNGKYYVVSGYVGNNEPTLTGCNKLSSYITVTASSTEVWCAILKATSNTITANTTIQMIEL